MSDNAELRPALTTDFASETERAYRKRFVHYQHWCGLREPKLQPGAAFITTAKVLEYTQAQIRRWSEEDLTVPDPQDYRRLRPETIRQAFSALVWSAERAGVPVPDVREAKAAQQAFSAEWSRQPLWTVAARGGVQKETFTGRTAAEVLTKASRWMPAVEGGRDREVVVISSKFAYTRDEETDRTSVSLTIRYSNREQ